MGLDLDLTDGLNPDYKFSRPTNISALIFTSLQIRLGSWWQRPDFGSRLHELKKMTDENIRLAAIYSENALQWLIDTGKAISISATANKEDVHRIKLTIKAVQANRKPIIFEHFVPVV